MHPKDQEKTAFVAMVMMFALKTAPAMFQSIITEIFGEFIPTFMQVFLNEFAVYGARADHLGRLRLCLARCRSARLSLNPAKCAFRVTSGALLGHIVSKYGIAVNSEKIKVIVEAPTPCNTKALNRFLGQSRMLRYLVDFATPLHATVHCTPFKWMVTEDKAYEALKVMLTQAPPVV